MSGAGVGFLAGEILVETRGISKRFPGVLANDGVNLSLRAGEVHALLGENGAGKTTLMSILSGLYQPDSGVVLVDGRPAVFRSPRDAIRAGIGMVHQHFRLVEPFTVAENITLGLARPRFTLDPGRVEAEVAALGERHGLKVDPRARIWQLSVGEQQRVEILKMLYRGARVLILDEPTAVLTPQEARELFAVLRQMAASGHAIAFISHKLQEVMEVADRISVLRSGRNVATLARTATTPQELARLMVGREVSLSYDRVDRRPGEVLLALEGVEAMSDRGLPALRGLSVQVRAGEILGIAGVSGNGQRELAEVISGLRALVRGTVQVGGTNVTGCHPARVMECGLSLVPEDRLGTGLVPSLPVCDNVILKAYRQPPISRGVFLQAGEIRRYARDLVERFAVRVPGLDAPVRKLSGGNLQRLLLAREISAQPRVLVAVHPTRGLDVGATAGVHRLLLQQRDGGAAILLISEDLDEIMALSDRVAVMYEGQIVGEVPGREARLEEIGLMMAGMRPPGGGWEA
ncbi:MAG: ABC transporter ATP-binding protein [Bacillota bacterium]